MTETKTKTFAQQVESELDAKYQLIFISQGDRLSDEQVSWAVSGDYEALNDSMSEWVSDVSWESAREELTELAKLIAERMERNGEIEDADDLLAEFEGSDEWTELVMEIQSRDVSDPVRDLARETPAVLFRVRASEDDFDGEYWNKADDAQPSAAAMLAQVGFEATPENLSAAQEIIDEANTHGTLFWLFAADVSDLIGVGEQVAIEVRDPYLFLTNVYAGNGYESEVYGTARFPRSELRTDKQAVGYGWDEIAGVYPSSYRCDVTVVKSDSPAAV